MQRMCHEFDMNFGGSWSTDSILSDENKELYKARYQYSSLTKINNSFILSLIFEKKITQTTIFSLQMLDKTMMML